VTLAAEAQAEAAHFFLGTGIVLIGVWTIFTGPCCSRAGVL
jgi:hypothetical protein